MNRVGVRIKKELKLIRIASLLFIKPQIAYHPNKKDK